MDASDEDESIHRHQKRRRVSKACIRCRQSKLKCDGASPRCGTCLKAKKSCSYETPMRRRGLRTGYVRALECIWGLVFQSIQGSEQTVAKLIANTSRKSFWTRDEPREGQKSGQPPIDTWKSSTIPGAIDALLSDVVDELDGNELDAGSFDTSELGIEAEISWHLSQQPHQSRADHRGVSSSPSNHPEEVVLPWTALPSQLTMDCSRTEVQTDTYCPGTDGSARTQVRQLPSNAQQLLNRYFAVTHSWFPILDRHAVYKTFFAYRNKFAVKRPEKWESAEDAVMWAIFAYASMLHVPQGVESTNVKQNVSSCLDDLYVTARQMLPLEREDGFTVGHVQVLLILSLFHYTSGECHLARMLTGQAVLVAGHIGLDELDKYPKDCHRRVWLGCFVLETLLAVSTGKPPRIQSHQIQAFLPIDNSGSEEWEPWQLQDLLLPGAGAETAELAAPRHSLTVFAQLVELLRVFNHWICDDAGRLDKNYNQLLKSWGDSLPEHITAIFNTNIASSAPSVSPPPNMLNLYMVYAVVNTKLSSSSDLASEFNGGHILRTLVNATEGVCRCFDQCSIPPSFAILRSLLPSKSAEQGTLGDAISELKRILRKTHIQQERTAYSLKIPLEGNLQESQNLLDISVDTQMPNLGPRIEQHFASFMDTPVTWPNMTTGIIPAAQTGFENAAPQLGHPSSLQIHPDDAPSQNIMSHMLPGSFNQWDDIEVDPGQFRRNLGFMP